MLVVASLTEAKVTQASPELVGFTHDVSETGISMVVTSLPSREHEQFQLGTLLQIKLSLPVGVVEMQAAIVRRESSTRGDIYIGARITKIGGHSNILYNQYLNTLN
ncbi:MAG: PilZ domain-containing protein [Acidobacteria bacterium]|nr:PilZ domain-containing protein [Acidobacteriota bacterium]